MSRLSAAVWILALSMATGAAAQQTSTAKPANAAKTPATADKPAPAPRPDPAQAANIKFDLTITDQTGSGEPAKKTVSLLVADMQTGYIRSSSVNEKGQVRLNVDARPHILPSGNVRAMLSLEYPSISQQVTVILEPGKPLLVTQAADPLSDRKVTVEVRVTVVR